MIGTARYYSLQISVMAWLIACLQRHLCVQTNALVVRILCAGVVAMADLNFNRQDVWCLRDILSVGVYRPRCA